MEPKATSRLNSNSRRLAESLGAFLAPYLALLLACGNRLGFNRITAIFHRKFSHLGPAPAKEDPLFRKKPHQLPPCPLFPVAIGAGFGVLLEDFLHLPLPCWLVAGAITVTRYPWRNNPPTPADFGSPGPPCPPSRPATLLVLLSSIAFGLLHHVHDTLSSSRPGLEIRKIDSPVSVLLRGTVATPPVSEPSNSLRQSWQFRLDLTTPSEPTLVPAKSSVLVHWNGTPPDLGDLVLLRAALRKISPPRNPSQFDKATFQRRQQLWLEASLKDPLDGEVLSKNTSFHLAHFTKRCSDKISEQIRRGIEDRPQTHALISSMILGIQGAGLMEAKPIFRDTGTLHLFAVSGLNLSMLSAFLGTLLRLFRFGEGIRGPLILPVLVLYALTTGLGPSCFRALFMSVLLMSVFWVNRPTIVLNSLAGAAILLLGGDTNILFNTGFQLSFGLVFALALLTPSVSAFFERAAHPDELIPRKLWNSSQILRVQVWRPIAAGCSVTSVAWGAGLPWNVYLFHQLTPISLLANLVAVPIAFVNLTLGFFALLAAPLGQLTPFLNQINACCAESLFSFLQWSSRIPGARFPIAAPFQVVPAFLAFDTPGASSLMFHSEGHTTLVNTGSDPQARSILMPALRSFGLSHIDKLLLSHGSSPHIGGAFAIMEEFRPSLLLDSTLKDRSKTRQNLQTWFQSKNTPTQHLAAGETLQITPHSSLQILHPSSSPQSTISDDKCLVLRWQTPDITVLYTASSGFPTERWLLENCKQQLAADVWVRGWHPKEITGTDEFVRAIHPRAIIVATQKYSKDPEGAMRWANRWRAEGIDVYLQQNSGAVWGTVSTDARSHRTCIESMLGGSQSKW